MEKEAGALLAERQAEQERVAAEAHAAAQARLEARIAAGFDPDDSLIEKLRQRLDLASVLTAHGYDRQGDEVPSSRTANQVCFGADIKSFGGIERMYSHNATDLLHRDNLPEWCGGVTALDVVDVVTILDFGGDRTRALRELAERFGINKPAERRTLAKLIFSMVRRRRLRKRSKHRVRRGCAWMSRAESSRSQPGAQRSPRSRPHGPIAFPNFGQKDARSKAWQNGKHNGAAPPHNDTVQEEVPGMCEFLGIEAWAARSMPDPDRLLGDLVTTTTRVFLLAAPDLARRCLRWHSRAAWRRAKAFCICARHVRLRCSWSTVKCRGNSSGNVRSMHCAAPASHQNRAS